MSGTGGTVCGPGRPGLFGGGGPQLRTLGDDYWDVLPSLNLSLRTPNDLVVRVAARREIQRPRLDQMRLSIGYGVDRSGPVPIIRGGGAKAQTKTRVPSPRRSPSGP